MNKEMKEKSNILQHFIFFLSVISSETIEKVCVCVRVLPSILNHSSEPFFNIDVYRNLS